MNPLTQIAEQLRSATRTAHRALDHHPLLTPLTRSPLSPAAYANALAALHGPQKAIEEALSGFVPENDFPSRLPDLEHDLEILRIAPFPLMAALPCFNSAAQRIGALYVIEGSNLGGAVIARLLDESLPASFPRQFFARAGGNARWEKFWQFAAVNAENDRFSVTTETACKIFQLYKMHLDQCLLGSERQPKAFEI
mgnify:FL=1